MSGPHSAFFYGTLMEPKVFFTVTQGDGRPPQVIRDLYKFRPAVLKDYTRHRVEFADYPGMIPEKGGSVKGIYATGLTDANISKLDFFEGSEYVKKMVVVNVRGEDGKDKEEPAMTYVFQNPDRLERVEWSFEEFRRDKLHIWTRESYVFEGCDDNAEFEKIEHEDADAYDKENAVKDAAA